MRELLTGAEAARLLNVQQMNVLRWTRSGKLKAAGITERGAFLYTRRQVEAFDQNRRQAIEPVTAT